MVDTRVFAARFNSLTHVWKEEKQDCEHSHIKSTLQVLTMYGTDSNVNQRETNTAPERKARTTLLTCRLT